MDRVSNVDEMVSALADGELHGDDFARSMNALAHQDGLRATWHAYHLIGDVLRSPELAATSDGADFVTRFRERLQREPEPVRTGATALQPQEQVVVARPASRREAANAPGFGWPMVAGIASLAAVAAIAWSFIGSGGPVGGAELAQATPAAASSPTVAQVSVAAPQPGRAVMIRDARLDELLAAHRQAGGASALQMPAGFLRNATFESPGR